MKKNQVKAIIKLLNNKDLEGRPALRQVFEQGGKIWATDGYICYEIGEVNNLTADLTGKSISLDALKAWNATSKANDMLPLDLFTANNDSVPDMAKITTGNFSPASDIKVNIDKLKLACDFLGCKSISLEVNENNDKLYRIKPLVDDEIDILVRAMDPKVYIMGLSN